MSKLPEIPAWVIEYNNANHKSSAGKAIKILMMRVEELEKLTFKTNFVCDECKFTRSPHEHRCLDPENCKCEHCCAVREYAKSLQKPDLKERDAIITLLEKYSRFLEDHGYTDTDWRTEKPYAIDEFMKTL